MKTGIKNLMKKTCCFLILAAMCVCQMDVAGGKAFAKGGSIKKLEVGKIYSDFDVTGDGKKDVFSSTETHGYYRDDYDSTGISGYLKVYVNGKCALSVKLKLDYDMGVRGLDLVTLPNGKKYLMVSFYGVDEWHESSLYCYKNGKFIQEVELDHFLGGVYSLGAEISSMSGNKMIVKIPVSCEAIGPVALQSVYMYRSGKLRLQSKTHKIYGYPILGKEGTCRKYWLTAKCDITIYQDKGMKKKSFVLKKGERVKEHKMYISGKKTSCYLKRTDGRSGWLRIPDLYGEILFEEIVVAM